MLNVNKIFLTHYIKSFIHSLPVTAYPLQGCGGGWSQSQLTLESCQFITGLTYRDKKPFTLTPTSSLEPSTNLMSLDCGRKPENQQGKHANSTQKGPTPAGYRTHDSLDVRQEDLNSNPGPSCYVRQQC